MHGDVDDDHALAVKQPGLSRVAVMETAEAEATEEGPADGAAVEDLLDAAHWVLEAEILVDHEGQVLGSHGRDHGPGILEIPGQRLLADRGHPVLGSEMDHLRMRRGSSGDVDEVKVFIREELGGVGVGPPPEVAGGGFEALRIGVAHGDELDIGDLCPGMEMVLREEAGADDGEAVGLAHNSTGLVGSVIHSLQDPTYIREPSRPAMLIASTFCAAVMPEPQ